MNRQEIFFRCIVIRGGVLVLLATALPFAGCTREATNSISTNTNTRPQQAPIPAPTQASRSNNEEPPPPVGPAIARADGDLPGIRVEVQELKRTSGDTVTLKFAMINDSDKQLDVGITFGEEGKSSYDYYSIGGVHMIDAAGKKKYFVVRDSEQQCLCSRNVKGIGAKSRAPLWAKFPAPTGDVQKITVVVPHFIPMDDVPISQ